MEGYGFTPNKMIPLNDREPGEIAKIAWQQLKPYRIAAETWPVYRHFRDKRHSMCCRLCTQCLWFVTDITGEIYQYTDEETLTLIVAHIRRCHEDMINEKGEFSYEGTGEYQVLDSSYNPHAGGSGSRNSYRPEYQGGNSTGIEQSKEDDS